MDPEQLLPGRAIGRIHVAIACLSAAGALAATLYGGWRWGLGFLTGAAASWVNFRWLKQLVDSLGSAVEGRRPRSRVAVLFGLRYVLLAAGAYVILNFSALSVAAALIGLFVPAAAVILEILFELVYARA